MFLVDAGRVYQSEFVGNDPSRALTSTYPIRIPNSEISAGTDGQNGVRSWQVKRQEKSYRRYGSHIVRNKVHRVGTNGGKVLLAGKGKINQSLEGHPSGGASQTQ